MMPPPQMPNTGPRAGAVIREIIDCEEDEQLLHRITTAIGKLISCDGVWFNSLDLRDGRHRWNGFHGAWPSRYEESSGEGEIDAAFAAYRWDHPFLGLCNRDGWLPPVSLSDFVSQPRWTSTPLFNEYYREAGVRHQAGFSIGKAQQHFIGITLNRTHSHFRTDEVSLLRELQPWCTAAFRGAMRRAWWRAEIDLLRELPGSGYGLVLLTRRGQQEWMSEDAEMMLRPWGRSLPPEVLERIRAEYVASAYLPALPAREWQMCVGREPRRLVCHCITAPRSAVLMQWERGSASLTVREREILHWVAEGKTNAEIALIVSLSVRTVEKHVERAFKKLGISRRSNMASETLRLRKP